MISSLDFESACEGWAPGIPVAASTTDRDPESSFPGLTRGSLEEEPTRPAVLGDLHNLFGDTNAVHVRLGPAGDVMLDSVIKGDTVREMLNQVQFSSDSLVAKLRRDVETALRESRLTYEESGALLKFYEEGLHGYTYLEDVHEQ